MALREDAGRYECGTLNTIGCFGLRAAIEFLLEVGVGEIAPVVQNLGNRIAEGVRAKGYELMGERTPETGAGIVSFRKAGLEASAIVREAARSRNRHRPAKRVGAHLAAFLHQPGRYRPVSR